MRVPPAIPGISDWRPLARGGFATVWQARQDTLDRQVAVKVDERTLDSDSERRRFLTEARVAGQLSGHPGIVTVHDGGILSDGRPYLVMKLCTGGSLTRWLRPENRQPPEQIRAVGVRIADALAAAHAQGMLHRDVKPANILIDGYGHAALADFGLAAPVEAGPTEGMTLAYAPPEAIRREPPTAYGDVYQLAATLYALLCGDPPREPVGGRISLEDLTARLDEPVPPLPGVPEDLMRLLLDGLAPVPTDRPTAAELRDRLATLDLDGTSGVGADAWPHGSTALPEPRRRHLVLTLVASVVVFVLVALLGASGFYLYEIDRSVTANISRGIDLPERVPGLPPRPTKDPKAPEALDYVLIGTDQGNPEDDGQGPNDSIMLVHIDQAREQAYVISVPPDTYVNIPGPTGRNTVTKAYHSGGASLLVRTLEQVTGTRMDHVAVIDFQGFVNLTQDLEGVTVHNDVPFTSNGYIFSAGDVTLSGDQALAYVRGHQGAAEELLRAKNQRVVLKAVMAKGLSPDVLADPLRFTRFVGNAAKRVQVDNSLTDSELRSTAVSLRLSPQHIRLLSMPVSSKTLPDGRRVEVLRGTQSTALGRALRSDTMERYLKKYPKG